MGSISETARAVEQMDKHLRDSLLKRDGILQEKKLWENTYIKHQLDKRNSGVSFSINDHIQGMVYSMLSSGSVWKRVEPSIDLSTGRIVPIDEAFHQYNPDILLQSSPEQLLDDVKRLVGAGQSTKKQMNALIHKNIGKLIKLENEYGSIDAYYQKFIKEDETLKSLVKALSGNKSKDKMTQMGIALTAEYLRNVGYDIPKPDRHIRRILGSKLMACSKHEIVPEFEAFDIIRGIAEELCKSTTEVDYILWSYCADGYGEICKKDSKKSKPKCKQCVAKEFCKTPRSVM